MKRVIFTTLGALLLLCSCATTNKADTGKKEESSTNKRLEQVVADIKKVKGEHGDIWVEDVPLTFNETYSASNFYAANIFLAMDNLFDFSTNLTEAQLLDLGRALFKNLPVDEEWSDLRAIVVSKYYEGGSNLVIIIDRVTLKEGVVPGQKYGYRILTNALPQYAVDNKTGKKRLMNTGEMINSKVNYNVLMIPFENGSFVKANNLNLGKQQYSIEMSYMDKGNLMDTFIKDEIPENDEQVEKIYNEIKSSDAEPAVKNVLGPLNYGLYLTKLGKYDEAEKLWNNIDLKGAPEKTEESFESVFNHDIPFLLKIMKGL